ncbi:hypothetical protein DSO57_1000436 [Entomophthora muscae]|uniref:Uncharacterized protein n=1 Tax=Entomophthora muscae TaxID=34485 RepID=A0ACC2UI96_9FUNG|nr:hypothetical protein DSO57_1000436 [Entomophthora muscae]
MFAARRDFTTLQAASSFVSQRRRQALNAREERQQYLHLKAIATTTQLRYRSVRLGASIRHAYVIYRTAAIKIQATWKMIKARSYFKMLLWATQVIAYRRSLTLYARDMIRQYKLLRVSTITIQQRFRHLRVGMEARNRYIKARLAATSIQALWRKVAARSSFVSLRWAAATVARSRRNLLQARATRQQYVSLKSAALVVQNRFRLRVIGRISRNAFEGMRSAAVMIQSRWRLASARSNYVQLRWAAGLVAAKRRGTVLARFSSQRYLGLRKAIVNIQQRYRLVQFGNTLRNQFKAVRASAITIQAYWRRATARSDFLWSKWASTVTVRRRKQLLMARKEREAYLQLKSSATLIQSCWRMAAEISRFRSLRQAAILVSQRRRLLVLTRGTQQAYQTMRASTIAIQAIWRMSTAQSDYSWLRWAATLVAQRRRQLVRATSTRCEYLNLQRVTVAVQERWRSTILTRSIRENYLRMRWSAVKVQAMWRKVMASSDFVWLRWAASIVVYHRRNIVLTRNIHQEYTSMRSKAIFVQQRYRLVHHGRTVQANFEAMKRSAVVIQTSWRRISARSSFLWLRWAADVVSERRRQQLLGRDAQQNYISLCLATTFIQQRYRLIKHGETVCANYRAMRNSAIVIQTHWRSVTARSSFLWYRWAASIVAQRRRQALQASSVRLQYLEIQAAAVFLQRRYRLVQAGKAAQAGFTGLKEATIKIQAQWRRADAKAKFSYLKNAATLVAQRRRQSVLARATYQQYIHLRSTAISLQNIYRNHQLARLTRERFVLVRSSAIVIQSYWRGVTAQVDYAWLVWASRVVAQRRRLLLVARQTREKFLNLRAASCFIQQAFRNSCLAASIRNSYIAEKVAAIKFQTLWRRAVAVRDFQRLQHTAHFVTRLRHQSVIARTVRFEYLQVRAAAISVQRKYRQNRNAALIHREYTELRSATITLQAHWKRLVARSNFLWLRWAAQCIAERRKLALQAREERGQYIMLTWSAVVAQRAFRHYRSCAVVRTRYIQMVNSALVIQHALRAHWHRQALKEQATVVIQSHWRGRQIRVGFLMLRWATTFIAACRRARAIQIEYSRVRSAAIAIQRCWRHLSFGAQCQLEFQRLRLASTVVQRLYRRRATIRNNCATLIQNAWYSWKQRAAIRALIAHKWAIRSKWKAAATKVIACQVLWRHCENMRTAAKFSRHQAVSGILSIWRTKCDAKLAAIREARLVQLESESAAFIQVVCRGYLARKQLWAAQTIAIGTQSLYRGYLVRKSSRDEVQKACRGVMRACREAKPHMILSYRTTEALEILNHSSSLTRIIHACEHLVVVTQLSSSCRQRLVNQYHVIQIILELMRSCNRSQPHQEILRHAVVILENISRDPNCDWGRHVTPKEVDDLVATMLDHKDLHHILTSLMVTLNYLMSHPVGFQSVVSTSQVLTRLRMIHLSMQRHQRKFPNAPPLDHSLPLRSAKYSIGLVGLSSLDTFDQNAMMTSFIHKLKV